MAEPPRKPSSSSSFARLDERDVWLASRLDAVAAQLETIRADVRIVDRDVGGNTVRLEALHHRIDEVQRATERRIEDVRGEFRTAIRDVTGAQKALAAKVDTGLEPRLRKVETLTSLNRQRLAIIAGSGGLAGGAMAGLAWLAQMLAGGG